MPLLALKLISDPKAWAAIAFVLYSGWLFTQGRHFEQRRHVAAIEATNGRVRASNAKWVAAEEKEEALRRKALSKAKLVLAAQTNRCIVTAAKAEAHNRIQ